MAATTSNILMNTVREANFGNFGRMTINSLFPSYQVLLSLKHHFVFLGRPPRTEPKNMCVDL